MIYLYIAIIGAVIGSFLNVVIYRLPIILGLAKNDTTLSLALPASHCPNCQHKLKWWHNVPIFSYLILRGKCFFCQHRISPSYIFVELASSILAVLCFFIFADYQAIIACVFCWLLIPLVMIDAKYHILPDEITYIGIWLGILLSSVEKFGYNGLIPLQISVYGAVGGYLFLWLVRQFFLLIKNQETLGLGDCKMLAMVGAFLGLKGLVYSIMLASITGIVAFLVISLQKKTLDTSTKIPFGPFIALGAMTILCLQSF